MSVCQKQPGINCPTPRKRGQAGQLPPPARVRGGNLSALVFGAGKDLAPRPPTSRATNEAAPRRTPELRVGAPALVVCCLPQGNARLGVGAGSVGPIAPHWAHKRRVDRSCTPPKPGSPFATTRSRHPSDNCMPRLRSRRKTFVATRAPASRQTRATARSSGPARRTSTPAVGQAVRWSPSGSRAPPQRHARGSSGSGRRRRRSRTHRNVSS